MSQGWTFACEFDELITGDVKRWDIEGHSLAIFRSKEGKVSVTDNICTHGHAFLSDGFVEGEIVECPRHSGRFNFLTGEAMGAPVCDNLMTYQCKVENGRVYVLVA